MLSVAAWGIAQRPGKQEFDYTITNHTMVHEQVQYFFRGFRRDAHPMAIMCGVVGGLSAFYHDRFRYQRPVPSPGGDASADR